VLGERSLPQPVLVKENALFAQCVSEFERLLRGFSDSRLIRGDRFSEQIGCEGKHHAIVPFAHRMGDSVRLMAPEEQDVIRVSNDFFFANVFDKHSRAREDDVIGVGSLFGATFARVRPTRDIANSYSAAPMQDMSAQGG